MSPQQQAPYIEISYSSYRKVIYLLKPTYRHCCGVAKSAIKQERCVAMMIELHLECQHLQRGAMALAITFSGGDNKMFPREAIYTLVLN